MENKRISPIQSGKKVPGFYQKNFTQNNNKVDSCTIQTIYAEQAVLGSIIQDNKHYYSVKDKLEIADFTLEEHQTIYKAIQRLEQQKCAFDLLTLSNCLHEQQFLNKTDGQTLAYVTELIQKSPCSANIQHYVALVKKASLRRNTLEYYQLATNMLENSSDPEEALNDSIAKLVKLQSSYFLKANQGLLAIEARELLTMQLPPRELILSPWLAKQSLNMIYAPRGIGKTHVSLGIAYAIATGKGFLGWQNDKRRGVLFIDGELPAYVLQERLILLKAMNEGIEPEGLKIITPDKQTYGMPDLATLEGQQSLKPFITEQTDVVIVDNLSTLVRTGKENEGESWQPIQNWALDLRAKGKSVIFIHHSGKGGQQRGTSKREDVLDVIIALKRPDNYSPEQGACFEVHFEKARAFCGEEAKPFLAQLVDDKAHEPQWVTTPLEQSNFDKVIELANEGLSQRKISRELKLNPSTVSRHITKARGQGLIKQNTADS